MLPLLATLALAAPPDCLEAWAQAEDPAPATSRRCIQAWYAEHLPGDEDLLHDPRPGHAVETELTARQLERLADHVREECATPDEQTTPCGWLVEYFEAAATSRFRLLDRQYMADREPILARILAGERLEREALAVSGELPRWSPLSLWLFEHAVYARHGKRFEHPDLRRFFYEAEAVEDTELLPLEPGGWRASALDDADRHNLALIRGLRGAG